MVTDIYKDVNFVTLKFHNSQHDKWKVSSLQRFEFCQSDGDNYPQLIRFREEGDKVEQVFVCNTLDLKDRVEVLKEAKSYCAETQAEINKDFCENNLNLRLLPSKPL